EGLRTVVWAAAELLARLGSGVPVTSSSTLAVFVTIVPVTTVALTFTVMVNVIAAPTGMFTLSPRHVTVVPVLSAAGQVQVKEPLAAFGRLARTNFVLTGTVSLSVTVGLLPFLVIWSGPALVATIV